MVRFGVPGQNVDPVSYADGRLATVPVVQAPRRPTTSDKKFPMWCEWRVNKNASAPSEEGEFWKLIRFESNGDATWVQVDIGSGGPGVDDLLDQVDQAVGPNISGQISVDGVAVDNAANPSGIPLESVADTGTNTLDMQIQVSTARTGAPGDKNDAGICSFSDAQFAVDDDGYVTLTSAGASGVINNTGDDAVQVSPDGAGDFFWIGKTVSNATHAKPVYFKDSTTANAIDLDVQVAAAVTGAPGDKNDAGIASFNDSFFTVDADGYVSLTAAGTGGISTQAGDDAVQISPNGSGEFFWLGQTVANGTNAKPLYFVDSATANAIDLDIQVGAAVTGAPGDKNDAGIVSFDDTQFSVDADGYVTLASAGFASTITGDSGGALSPTSNNWNILGGPGVTTSGSGSTLTINSVVYSDQTSTTLTSDSGTWATAAGAYTLPASPTEGELVEIVCITTGIVVTANTGQEIQLGADVTTTAGTATNSAKGDALVLRYRATDTAWYATSVVGVWSLT